jgi:hypothetical protein
MAINEPAPPRPKRNAAAGVKVFVLLHIVAITSWTLPNADSQYLGSPPRTKLRIKTDSVPAGISSTAEYLRTEFLIGNQLYVKDSPLKFYTLTTGFWQYWDMFAPNPASIDIYADAMITYKNGTKKRYQYPRIFSLSLGQKFLKERWRKFFERAGSKGFDFQYLKPIFAQRIALMNFDDPTNPPVSVELHRHEMVINSPDGPENHAYSDEIFGTYPVNQVQLRKDKGL